MDHCQKMIDMIKAEFESSRAKELGEMEGQTSNRITFVVNWLLGTEMRVCLHCVKGPHKDQDFPIYLKPAGYFVYIIICRKYTQLLEGQQVPKWLRRELAFRRIVKCPPIMEKYELRI